MKRLLIGLAMGAALVAICPTTLFAQSARMVTRTFKGFCGQGGSLTPGATGCGSQDPTNPVQVVPISTSRFNAVTIMFKLDMGASTPVKFVRCILDTYDTAVNQEFGGYQPIQVNTQNFQAPLGLPVVPNVANEAILEPLYITHSTTNLNATYSYSIPINYDFIGLSCEALNALGNNVFGDADDKIHVWFRMAFTPIL